MNYPVIEVNAGGRPDDKAKYVNKRAEMWSIMREWLEVADIPEDDTELFDDLTNPMFKHTRGTMMLQLESKEEMKERGVGSPDRADALAHCFAYPHTQKIDSEPDYEAEPDY